jgi:hypothetical protein
MAAMKERARASVVVRKRSAGQKGWRCRHVSTVA